MKRNAGIWLDHRSAFVVLIGEGADMTERIESGMEKHGRAPSRSASKEGSADNQRERQFATHLSRYYDEVISRVGDAESIFLMGPGEAKGELEKRIESKGMGGRIVASKYLTQ